MIDPGVNSGRLGPQAKQVMDTKQINFRDTVQNTHALFLPIGSHFYRGLITNIELMTVYKL